LSRRRVLFKTLNTNRNKRLSPKCPYTVKINNRCQRIGNVVKTRSQAVARVADRTASQHPWGSRDVIGNVTIW